MPSNTTIFLIGLAVGAGLLNFGLLLGYWLGRRSNPPEAVDRHQFLTFLKNLSQWTSEFSGDVNKYQTQLTSISEQVQSNHAPPREEIIGLLAQIMQANRQLQERLDSAEQKLDVQTDQISNYLTEARTDGLTGLLNRRAFDKATDGLFADWTKKGQSFSLGLIDIDHFKHINDTYGHPAGDAVLKRVSSLIQTELGEAVCVARYGGEEFGMLTTDSAQTAATALDRLRQAVSQIEVTCDNHLIKVTLSAGVAQIESNDKIGNLVRRADEALYAAKLGGRNRVYLHDGTTCHLITKVPLSSPSSLPVEPATKQAAELATKQAAELAVQSETEKTDSHIQQRLQRIVEEETQRLLQRSQVES